MRNPPDIQAEMRAREGEKRDIRVHAKQGVDVSLEFRTWQNINRS